MPWYYYAAYFFVGALLANAPVHFLQGTSGNKFQTPFASPRGGESSAVVNVVWGWFNFVVAGALMWFFPVPLLPPLAVAAVAMLGALVLAVYLASRFGKVRTAAPHP